MSTFPKFSIAAAITLAALFAATPGRAQFLLATGTATTTFNYPGSVGVTITKTDVPTATVPTSANDFTTIFTPTVGSAQNLDTYCVDIFHSINGSSPGPAKLFEASSFTDGRDLGNTSITDSYKRAGLGRAAWLVNTYANVASVDKVALQLAVWKAEYEAYSSSGANYDNLIAGTLYFSSVNSTIAANAKAYLDYSIVKGVGGQFATSTGIWVSYQDTSQDQIARNPNFNPNFGSVPEPASVAMWGTAFLVVSGLAYRNKRKLRVTN
jgi:hypothetical protein